MNEMAAAKLFTFCVLDIPGNFLNSCYAFTVTGIKLIDEVLQRQQNANKVLRKKILLKRPIFVLSFSFL